MKSMKLDVAGNAVISTLWSGASHYWLFGLGLVKTVFLARLVPPEYFGMVAIAQAWVTYFSIFRFDFRTVVVTMEDDSKNTLSVQYWLDNLLSWSGLILAGICYLVSPSLLFLFGDVPVDWISNVWLAVVVLLVVIGFDSLTSTPRYLIERSLRQDIIAKFTIFHAIVGVVCAIGLAFRGYYLEAILVDLAIPVLVIGVGSVWKTRWFPKLFWDKSIARKLLEFAFTLWTTGLLGKIVFQVDDWLVGTITKMRSRIWFSSGILPVAYYSRAYSAGKMPMDIFAGMIGQIALPLYSRSASKSLETLKNAYDNLTWLLTNTIFLTGVFSLIATEELVSILLGSEWLPTVPLFRMMSGFVLLRPLYQNACQLLLAVRREKSMRRTVAYQAFFLIVVCPGAVYMWGAAGAAVSISVMSVLGLFFADKYVSQTLGSSSMRLYKFPILTCIAAYGMLLIVWPLIPDLFWLSALLKGVLCLAIFLIFIIIFDRKRLREVSEVIMRILKERRDRRKIDE
ncbi:MAG TPA: hypothetical protein DGM69_04685 [Chloroflexi bacterium]|nr:hypothetical protein [Chloroflexota bacterium]|tara:strand:+ start:3955 stop:5487 length:1533 start_codon:yes stop_codon:yes gene_type:complete